MRFKSFGFINDTNINQLPDISGKYVITQGTAGLLYSSNYASTFTNISATTFTDACITLDGQTIYAIKPTTDSNPIKTINGGQTWSEITGWTNTGSNIWDSIDCSSDGKYVGILNTYDDYYYSTDYGVNFTRIDKSSNVTNGDVYINKTNGTHYVVSALGNSYLQKMNATGTTFTNMYSSSTYGYRTVVVSDDDKYILLSKYTTSARNREEIYLSTNSGSTFNLITGFTPSLVSAGNLALSKNGKYMYITSQSTSSTDSAVYSSSDFGNNWTTNLQSYTGRYSIDCSNQGIYVGLIGPQNISANNELSWSTDFGSTYSIKLTNSVLTSPQWIKINK